MAREFQLFILGSCWEVRIRKEEEEERLNDCNGFTDWTNRTIYVMDGREIGNLSVPEELMKKVLRHEIVHAFLLESGLRENWRHPEYGHDEEMVDWVAVQLYKISAACESAEGHLKRILKETEEHD